MTRKAAGLLAFSLMWVLVGWLTLVPSSNQRATYPTVLLLTFGLTWVFSGVAGAICAFRDRVALGFGLLYPVPALWAIVLLVVSLRTGGQGWRIAIIYGMFSVAVYIVSALRNP